LGRTGLKVSELGMGGHEYRRPLPTTLGRWGEIEEEKFMQTQPHRNSIVKKAVEAGINYFDPTHVEEARSLGLALKEMQLKDDLHFSVMSLWPFGRMVGTRRSAWRQIVIDDVEEKLEALRRSHADTLTILTPERDYSRQRMTATIDAFTQLKKEGKVSFLGASSHKPEFLAELMRLYDCFDTVMVPYNYSEREAESVLFPLAKALEVGVIAIKPFAWPYYGIPFMRFGPVEAESGPSTPTQISLRWVLRSPEVSTVLAGINSQAELDEDLAAITKEGEPNYEVLKQHLETANHPLAKKKLENMLEDPAVDIRHFAERALRQ